MIRYNLRHAFRRLIREPGFTFAVVATLALGVGANVAVFAVVEAVLLRSLPYPQADAVVSLRHRDTETGITKEYLALADYLDFVKQTSAFASISAYGSADATIFGNGEPFRVNALFGTAQLFNVLGVGPMLGRGLEPDDTRPGAGPVVVLGYELWRTRFNADSTIVGRSIQVDQGQRLVIGVAPPGMQFPPDAGTDVIIPMQLPAEAPAERRAGWVAAVGRLKPGQTVQTATANLAALAARFEATYPEGNRATTYYAISLRESLVGNVRPALLLLLAAVGVVLLIACVNVQNLLLARSLTRRHEMAIRLAVGAGRSRLAAQILAECLVLALVAGVVGVAVAQLGLRGLVALVPASVGAPGLADISLNPMVLLFAIGLIIVTAVACGIGGAFWVLANSDSSGLSTTRGATMGVAARRVTSGLVISEVALAAVLLIGAGMVLRTFVRVMSTDVGFNTADVLYLGVALPVGRYGQEVAPRQAFYQRAFAAVRAVPGVHEAGAAVVMPLTGNNWTQPFMRPEHPVRAGERPPDVGWQVASGGFFQALDIPVVAGRLFDERDRPDGPPVVIISESLQRQYFGDESAVGRMVAQWGVTAEVVGVVGDIRRAGLRDDFRVDMYQPFERTYEAQITLFIRTASDPESVIAPVQAALRELEPGLVFLDSGTMAEVATQSEGTTRLILWLLGVFALIALALAAVGIYGVMSHLVRQRMREFGTRLALGATKNDILWMVMKYGAGIAVAGTVIGVGVGLAAARALGSVVEGLSAADPIALTVAIGVVVGTTIAACCVPAVRASGVDPVRILAEE